MVQITIYRASSTKKTARSTGTATSVLHTLGATRTPVQLAAGSGGRTPVRSESRKGRRGWDVRAAMGDVPQCVGRNVCVSAAASFVSVPCVMVVFCPETTTEGPVKDVVCVGLVAVLAASASGHWPRACDSTLEALAEANEAFGDARQETHDAQTRMFDVFDTRDGLERSHARRRAIDAVYRAHDAESAAYSVTLDALGEMNKCLGHSGSYARCTIRGDKFREAAAAIESQPRNWATRHNVHLDALEQMIRSIRPRPSKRVEEDLSALIARFNESALVSMREVHDAYRTVFDEVKPALECAGL